MGKLPNLLIVADGMGGHKAGDFASRYAVEKLVECISESVYENPLLIVSDAIRVVNRRIYEKSQDLSTHQFQHVVTDMLQGYIHIFADIIAFPHHPK